MLILKKINNNVALAASDDGREVVVFGKGIGFHEAYQCAYAINRVFEKEFKQSCSDEELLYLMMHINRLRSASQTE